MWLAEEKFKLTHVPKWGSSKVCMIDWYDSAYWLGVMWAIIAQTDKQRHKHTGAHTHRQMEIMALFTANWKETSDTNFKTPFSAGKRSKSVYIMYTHSRHVQDVQMQHGASVTEQQLTGRGLNFRVKHWSASCITWGSKAALLYQVPWQLAGIPAFSYHASRSRENLQKLSDQKHSYPWVILKDSKNAAKEECHSFSQQRTAFE